MPAATLDGLLGVYLAQSPLAFVRFDPQHRIVSWPARAEHIFGYAEHEVLGRTCNEIGLIHAADEVRIVRSAATARTERWHTIENRNIRKDGTVIYCRWFNAFLDIGIVTGYVSLVEDITAEVVAREAAADAEQRARLLFEATPDAVTFVSLDGTIVDANVAAERMLRASREQLIGRSFIEMIGEDTLGTALGAYERILGGETINVNLVTRRPDGTTFPASVVGGPTWHNGRIVGAFASTRDMSEAAEARSRVAASEERFRSLFDHNPDAMLEFNPAGRVVRANPVAGELFALRAVALEGRTLTDLLAADDLPAGLAAFGRALDGSAEATAARIVRSDGMMIPTLVSAIPIASGASVTGVHLHIRDHRPHLEHERAAAAYAERIRDLYLTTAAANENAEQQIRATIEAGCRILGLASGALYEAAGDRLVDAVGDPIPAGLAKLAIAATNALAIDRLPPLADGPGGAPFGSFIGTPIDVSGTRFGSLAFAGPARSGTFDDVDRDLVQLMGALVTSAIERGRARARLQALAYNDAVTELPNRTWLIERLRAEIEHARREGGSLSVLFLDLDRFKDINDTLGHAAGDRLLKVVGSRLAQALRAGDIVARMGGDEFAVLAIGAGEGSGIAALADRIIAAVEEPMEIDGLEYYMTTSIGIAAYPADADDAETLVKYADVAMYRAKDRGRNTYQFFTPALNATIQSRLTLEKQLRHALENGEFVVYYMPEHELSTGRLVAVEALVRWRHPRFGIVPPGQFIPNAELSGLIVGIGDYVNEASIAQIADWRRRGLAPDLRLAINLSAKQFHHQRLAANITDAVRRHGLPPEALELEITESVAMTDASSTIAIMRELGSAGCRISVDDFGTGYSSLGYLRRFPLDSLKIDRSFVDEVPQERDDATIVRTVIAMAHALDLEVVAEGVENAAQLEFLRSERCDRVQGYFYSPPIPGEDLERYIIECPVHAG